MTPISYQPSIIIKEVPRIYLDHAATTPLLPEVRRAMEPWLAEFGNPSSLYQEGREAKDAIDEAREALSSNLGCLFAEIIFTSSGTEAANLAIVGAALANQDSTRNRILLGTAEHHCVLNTRPILERLGYKVEFIPVDRIARVQLDALESMIGPDVLLVSVMHANNELGTIQPIREIGEMARSCGSLYHCDAVQTLGTGHILGSTRSTPHPLSSVSREADLEPPGTRPREKTEEGGLPDLMTFSAHKIYGPKGAAAVFIKAGTRIQPIAVGGGQERELRAGTENVAAIAGFHAAVSALGSAPSDYSEPRNLFLDRLVANGFVATVPDRADTLSGHAHVRLPGVDAETMLIRLDRAGISASSGAACSSGSLEASHVLRACGYTERESKEGLRFTFGRFSTVEEAEEAASRVIEAASSIRG